MTSSRVWTEELDRHLAWLLSGGEAGLQGGAELEVRHPDGEVAFLAPLARHHRLEGRNLIWVRPIRGGRVADPDEPGQPPHEFDLDIARRRALECTAARVDGDAILVELATGQTAIVRPASPDALAELEHWDTYYLTALDARAQAELDALEHDP